jgi:hypothetical protein
MTREKALKLIEDWASKRCLHPHYEDEFHLGISTGNKVCAICGNYIYITVQKKRE